MKSLIFEMKKIVTQKIEKRLVKLFMNPSSPGNLLSAEDVNVSFNSLIVKPCSRKICLSSLSSGV